MCCFIGNTQVETGIKQRHKCHKYLGARCAITLEIVHIGAHHIFLLHMLFTLLLFFLSSNDGICLFIVC